MLIDSRTLFAPIVAECLALFLATALLAYRSDSNRRGLGWLAAALASVALAFTLIALRGLIPPLLSMWLANIILVAGTGMGNLAIAAFQKKKLEMAWMWLPALIIGAGMPLFADNLIARLSIASLIHIAQNVISVRLIWKHRRQTPGIGQYLILAGMLLNNLVLLLRISAALLGIDAIHSLTENTLSQAFVYFSVFLSLNLSPVGYILMDKEADDQRYRHLALRDRLTQCWNRTYLEQVARVEMERFRRYDNAVAMVILDIDLFKSVNDKFGHAMGDKVLRAFADTAAACIRSTDVLARWGGEEFIVLLPSSSESAARCMAERIRKAVIAKPICGLQLSVSAGYAACLPGESWDGWFQRADRALYAAKSLGRNRSEGSSLPGIDPEARIRQNCA